MRLVFGILHSKCCGISVNEKRFALQRIPIFQLSKIHRQKYALIACFVPAYCILHVQLVSRLCQKAFDVRFRSRYQEVIDVSSCFLLDVLSMSFETIEQGTVVLVTAPIAWNS